MSTQNLKQKSFSGMIWAAFQRYSKMIIQFIPGIILARLLIPYDYGCIGMLTIFVVLAKTFIDSGFGSALIQKKAYYPRRLFYDLLEYWNGGSIICCPVFLCSFYCEFLQHTFAV